MQTTPIRNQGNTIEMRMIAPRIEDAVFASIRRASFGRSTKRSVGKSKHKPPSKLSTVSMSEKKSRKRGSSLFQTSQRTNTFGEAIHDAAKRLRKMVRAVIEQRHCCLQLFQRRTLVRALPVQ